MTPIRPVAERPSAAALLGEILPPDQNKRADREIEMRKGIRKNTASGSCPATTMEETSEMTAAAAMI